MKRENGARVTPARYLKNTKSKKLTVITAVTRNCVLKCKYCFTCDPNKNFKTISDDVLEVIVRGAFEAGWEKVHFEWTGGEALLGGKGFFEKVLHYQNKYKKEDVCYDNSVQTSGAIYDEKLYDYLIEHKFIVSLTIDGPPDIHNSNRPLKNNGPSLDLIIKSLNYIKRVQGSCGAIATITRKSLHMEKEIIDYLFSLGVRGFHSNHYIYDSDKPTKDVDYAINVDEYHSYFHRQLKTFMDYDDVNLNIQQIRYIMQNLMGIDCVSLCSFSGRCLGNYIHFDSEGNATICGKFVGYDQHVLGNVLKSDVKTLLSTRNPRMLRYVKERMKCVSKCKNENCKYIPTCRYGCPYLSFISSGNKSIAEKDYLCSGKRKVFEEVDNLLHGYGVQTYTQFQPSDNAAN